MTDVTAPHPIAPSVEASLAWNAQQMEQAAAMVVYGILPADTDDDQLIDLWLKGKSPETRRAYGTDIALFRSFVGRSLRAVNLMHLHAFAESLAELEDTSVRRRMGAVKSLLSFGHKTGYLAFNVGAAYQPPKVLDGLAERILAEEDVQRMLFLEEDPRNHALLRILYSGGLRVSEAARLIWDRIVVREEGRAQLIVHGKGGKTRQVLLPAAVWTELRALQDATESASAEAPVFVSRGANGRRSGGPLTTRQVHRIVSGAALRAGLKEGVSPHWLRHAHTSHALNRGAPIQLVRETLGHGSLAVTGRYAHARPSASSADYLPM